MYFRQSAFIFLLLTTSAVLSVAPAAIKKNTVSNDPLKRKIERLYQGITGFGINAQEEKSITQQGGAPTYGEITYESLKTLIDDLKLTDKDVFYDLGSGVGKVALQVFLGSPVKKSAGIELSPTRCNYAQQVKAKLQKPNLLDKAKKKLKDIGVMSKAPERKLEFCNQNIVDADLSDATVIFMCSTCFSDDLMKKLDEKLSKLNKGLRILTLKKLPESSKLKLIKTYILPMTWSSGSSVYLYELNEPKKAVQKG